MRSRAPRRVLHRKSSAAKGEYDSCTSPALNLDASQRAVVDLITSVKRPNVFVTGNAGSGKSAAVRAAIDAVGASVTLITAPTGVAAVNIKGTTLHSAFGLRPGSELVSDPPLQVPIAQKLGKCKMLVIDEISMVAPALLRAVDVLCRRYRRCEAPFGGIQTIVCGDFLQLAPVHHGTAKVRYAFETSTWKESAFTTHGLRHAHRHERDQNFLSFLSKVRKGEFDTCAFDRLAAKSPSHKAVLLRCTNQEVNKLNDARFHSLASPIVHQYTVSYSGSKAAYGPSVFAHLPDVLSLKIGCRVMLIKNLDVGRGLVNGACGLVTDFRNVGGSQFPFVEFDHGLATTVVRHSFSVEEFGKTVCAANQIPLRLCWAATIHKAQGATIAEVDVDLHGIFERGQAYVALSRAKGFDGLSVRGAAISSLLPCPLAAEFMNRVAF